MEMLTFPEAEVPLALRRQVAALQEEAWPTGRPLRVEPWHDPALHPRSVVLVEDGRVLAALDILSKAIEHRGERYAASGLSTVVTARSERRKGYGTRLVAAARELIAASGADIGLFTCDPALRRFYERAGWRLLPGTVLIGGTREAPLPSDALGKVVMSWCFSARARAAAACFVGARIELHPGEIDRLW